MLTSADTLVFKKLQFVSTERPGMFQRIDYRFLFVRSFLEPILMIATLGRFDILWKPELKGAATGCFFCVKYVWFVSIQAFPHWTGSSACSMLDAKDVANNANNFRTSAIRWFSYLQKVTRMTAGNLYRYVETSLCPRSLLLFLSRVFFFACSSFEVCVYVFTCHISSLSFFVHLRAGPPLLELVTRRSTATARSVDKVSSSFSFLV